jgi:hypothetical protein
MSDSDAAVKTVSFDPSSTAASDLLASGGSEEALDALDALDVLDTMSEDGFFGKGSSSTKKESAKKGDDHRTEEDPDTKEKDMELDLLLKNTQTSPPPLDLRSSSGRASLREAPQSSTSPSTEIVPTPPSTQDANPPPSEEDPKEDDAISLAPSLSTCLGTESLIASGCVFTILEQFFRPTKKVEGTTDDTRSNITDTLKDIAGHLEKISLSLEKIASASSPPTTQSSPDVAETEP